MNSIDAKILKYLDGKGEVHQDLIVKTVKHASKDRLIRLKKLGYISESVIHLPSLRSVLTGEYQISDAGITALQDHSCEKTERLKAFIAKSVLVPIAVTILTLIATNLLKDLLPAWLLWLLQS